MTTEFKEYLAKITTLDFVTTAIMQYYKQFDIPSPNIEQLENIMLNIVEIEKFNLEEAKEIKKRINFLLEFVSNPKLQEEFEAYCKKDMN